MIIHNLLRHKGRTIMSIVSVAISTALLVSLLSVAEGIWQNTSRSVLASGEDILIVPDLPGGSGAGSLGSISNGHKIADDIKSDTTNISETSPLYGTLLKIEQVGEISSDNTVNTEPKTGGVLSLGVIPERLKKFLVNGDTYNLDMIELKFDDWFETPGDPHYENDFTGPWTYEVLVDDYLAGKYQLTIGSNINLSIGKEAHTFTVAGIFKTNLKGGYFEDFIDGFTILHLSELQSILGEDVITKDNRTVVIDYVKTIAISLKSESEGANPADDIAFGLQEKYPLLDVITLGEQLERLEEQNAMTRVFYTAISLVSIIIGLLFVACIMLISVYERINEIGILRAIGISRTTIFKWVILESLMLIIMGILIGFLPGYVGSELLGAYISEDIGISEDLTAFTPELVVWSFLGMLGIGTLMSLIPALRASTMKITNAVSFVR